MKLTLAIPTYNRARYLDVLLRSIANQAMPSLSDVEIVISDNASTDDTLQVVEKYLGLLPIRYWRNEENTGADRNIAKTYQEASGRYVWIIGDDDFLLPNALRAVMDTIDLVTPGLIFAKPVGFTDQLDISAYPNHSVDVRILSRALFVKRLELHLASVFALIVHKAAFHTSAKSIENLAGTNLVQYAWVLPLVLADRPLAYISTTLVASKSGNGAGYALFKVFVENNNRILSDYFYKYPALVKKINNRALISHFPRYITNGAPGDQMIGENKKDITSIFSKHYSTNFRYWLFIWPLFKSSPHLQKISALARWMIYVLDEQIIRASISLARPRYRFSYPAQDDKSA